jgi:hypothetical protein
MAAGLKLCIALLSTLALYPLLRMAYAAGGLAGALLLGFIAIAFPPSLVYGSRALAEVACVPFLTWGLWLLWPWGFGTTSKATWRRSASAAAPWWKPAPRLLGAGALLGLATVLRYQNGLFLPFVFAVVAWRRGLRAALLVTAGAALAGMLGGLLDWVTWGRPFQAMIAYVRFNLVEEGASQWGIAKRGFYFHTMLRTSGPLLLLLGVGFLAGLRKTWPVALLVVVFVGAHSAIPHKELRFLFPVLPLFLLCAALGMARFFDRMPYSWRRRITTAAATGVVMLAIFSWRSWHVTFTDIGQRMDGPDGGGPTSPSVWFGFDERNQLFSEAGTHADLCGLAAPGMNAYWTGGYTYLHRLAPISWAGGSGAYDAANFVVLGPGQGMDDARYQTVAVRGPYRLYRRDGGCVTPPRSSLEFGRLIARGVPGT